MKHFKSFFTLAVIALTMMLTSCLKEADPSENSYAAMSYFTIKGSYPNYKLYDDNGGIIVPTAASVQKLTDSNGFGDAERGMFSFTYKQKDISEDAVSKELLINNAILSNGALISVMNPIEKSVADEELITAKDSTASIYEFSQAWISRGYLNISMLGSYCKSGDKVITPTLNVVYDLTEFGENKMKLTLCYNTHKTADLNYVDIMRTIRSYRISDLASKVPGTDKINVVITPANGGVQKTITVDRKMFVAM